jgi:hypothetical protein
MPPGSSPPPAGPDDLLARLAAAFERFDFLAARWAALGRGRHAELCYVSGWLRGGDARVTAAGRTPREAAEDALRQAGAAPPDGTPRAWECTACRSLRPAEDYPLCPAPGAPHARGHRCNGCERRRQRERRRLGLAGSRARTPEGLRAWRELIAARTLPPPAAVTTAGTPPAAAAAAPDTADTRTPPATAAAPAPPPG